MIPDTGLDLDELDCAHVNVSLSPYGCDDGHIHDAWRCLDCDAEFLPAEEASAWRDAAHELRADLVGLAREHARLRVAATVLGVFTFGLLVGRR